MEIIEGALLIGKKVNIYYYELHGVKTGTIIAISKLGNPLVQVDNFTGGSDGSSRSLSHGKWAKDGSNNCLYVKPRFLELIDEKYFYDIK